MSDQATPSSKVNRALIHVSGEAQRLAESMFLTLLNPDSRPIAHFFDGQFKLLNSGRSVLETWSELDAHSCFHPTPGLLGALPSPLLTDLWTEWLLYRNRCENGDLMYADRENMWPSMEDIDFIRQLRDSEYESHRYNDLLEHGRELVIRSVEWELNSIVARSVLPCLLPWLDKNSTNRSLIGKFQSMIDSLITAMGAQVRGELPVFKSRLDFSDRIDEYEKLIMDGLTSTDLYVSRSLTAFIMTEPRKLPAQLQRGLLELFRERQNGITRKEMGSRLSGRSTSSKGVERIADQVRHKLVNIHGYAVSPHPWKLDARALPADYIEQIRELQRLLSATLLEDE